MSAVPITIGRQVHRTEQYHKSDLEKLMLLVKSQKRTGSLTLHITSGEVSVVEWKQKEKSLDAITVLCSNLS